MSDEAFKRVKELLTSKGFKSSIRLAIMIYLLAKEKVLFSDLVEALDVTPGNLWSHLEKLREEGLVKVQYVIRDRPRVMISITDKGYRETIDVVKTMIDLLDKVLKSGK